MIDFNILGLTSGQPANESAPVTAPTSAGIFGIPKIAMYVGLGVLGLGAAALVVSRLSQRKPKAKLAGYKRARKSRR